MVDALADETQTADVETSGTQLPPGWTSVPLKDVARTFISGGTPSTKETAFWEGTVPWTTSAPIAEDATTLGRAQRHISEQAVQRSASNIVPSGNLLIGTRVGVGKAVVNLLDIAISQDLTGVVVDHTLVDAGFLAYQFKMERIQRFIDGRKRGTTIKGISRFDLETVEMFVPPLPEQRAIARVLRTVQEAREARRREIALERERKAALMQHLFTHGTRGEPRKMTEIGEMPESWRVVRLGDICQISTGTTPSTDNPSYYKGSIPFIKTSAIVNNRIDKTDTFISENAVKDYGLKMYSPGTILMAMYGQGKTRGQVSLLAIPATTTQNTAAIVPSDDLNAEFAWHWLMSQYDKLREAGSQGHISHLNLGYVKRYHAPLPTMLEQIEIATILDVCNAKIDALEREAAVLDEACRALLEELMTGRVLVRGVACD